MKLVGSSLVFASVSCAATLTIEPATIVECTNGLGRARLIWSGASVPGEIRAGGEQGTVMTGVGEAAGVAETGEWVKDGLVFALVNARGVVEATAAARVRCGGGPASFYPLETGNTWVYRLNTRMVTSDYVTQRVTGTEEIGGQTWFVVSSNDTPVMRLRNDDQGRTWRLTGSGETLFINPAQASGQAFSSPLGTFADAILVMRNDALTRQADTYIRGIGLAKSDAFLMTGSSGGFTNGLELVEVRLASGLQLRVPTPRFAISAESRALDVTGRKVTNCAVPSYCVGCGLLGADPPGTYKPCFQTRVEANASSAYTVSLVMTDAGGAMVATARASSAGGELVRYVQLPLYRSPGNQPFAPGTYTLTGTLEQEGSMTARVVATLRVE